MATDISANAFPYTAVRWRVNGPYRMAGGRGLFRRGTGVKITGPCRWTVPVIWRCRTWLPWWTEPHASIYSTCPRRSQHLISGGCSANGRVPRPRTPPPLTLVPGTTFCHQPACQPPFVAVVPAYNRTIYRFERSTVIPAGLPFTSTLPVLDGFLSCLQACGWWFGRRWWQYGLLPSSGDDVWFWVDYNARGLLAIPIQTVGYFYCYT